MKLILISAWNDSGGGFLHRLFDGHPALRVWPFELLLGRDHHTKDKFDEGWFRGRFRWPQFGDAPVEDWFDLVSDTELKAVLSSEVEAKHRDYLVDVSLEQWREKVQSRLAEFSEVDRAMFLQIYVSSFFELWTPGAAGPVLGHCPVASVDWDEIRSDFPDFQMIHVLRDPWSGFAEMSQRHPDMKADGYARKWSLVNQDAWMRSRKHHHQMKLMPVERLLSAREQAISELSAWLGLEVTPGLQTVSWSGKALNEQEMGPFGGVRTLSLKRNENLRRSLALETEQVISEITTGTRDLLQMTEDCTYV